MSRNGVDAAISVVVVEDEVALREEVVAFLAARGIAVRGARDGAELWRLIGEEAPEAVVLDLGLPGEDGVAIAAELRRRVPSVGIVMMTARGSVQDRITGYETGANVYLVKPIDLGELIAAIRSTRFQREAGSTLEREDPPAWSLDLTGWRLTAPNGESIQLTRAEAQLLDCLTAEPGTPVSRVAIGNRMGKVADLPDHRYVDQVIRRLRRKIEAGLEVEAPLGSAHSQGYYFTQNVRCIHS